MENLGILCGIMLGLFGSIFSVVQFFWQKKWAERTEKEQAEKEAAKEKAQAEKEKAQAEKEAAKEKEQAEKEAAKEKAQAEKEAARNKEHQEQLELAKQEQRKAFLASVIMDPDIPRISREPFYQEYISLGGNGPVIKLWASGK